jgi:hypothetical protein
MKEQASPKLTFALEAAQKEIAGQFEPQEEHISSQFSSINSSLTDVINNISVLDTNIKSANAKLQKLDLLDEMYRQIGEINNNISQIKDITGKSNRHLKTVEKELNKVGNKLNPIYDKVVPTDKIPVGDCEMQANFGYDFQNEIVTLELELLHNGKTLKSWRVIEDNIVFLFELLIVRKIISDGHPSAPLPGLNPSDYILFHRYNSALSSPKLNTAERFITRFRIDIERFVSSHCTIPLRNKFMLKTRPHNTSPKYEFILDQQMSLTCNLIDFVGFIKKVKGRNELLDELDRCPRSIEGWEELANYPLTSLTTRQTNFLQKGKVMLIKSKEIYENTKSICESPLGENALFIYKEDLTDVPLYFGGWALRLDNIIIKLP